MAAEAEGPDPKDEEALPVEEGDRAEHDQKQPLYSGHHTKIVFLTYLPKEHEKQKYRKLTEDHPPVAPESEHLGDREVPDGLLQALGLDI